MATANNTSATFSFNESAALCRSMCMQKLQGDGSHCSTACWEMQVLKAEGCRRTLPFIVWRQRAVKRISWRLFMIFPHTKKKGDRLIMHCWFFPSSDTRFYLLWSWKGSIFCFFVFWRANRNGWDESGRVMRQETVWVLSAWLDRMLWAGTGVEHCPQIQTRLRA